MERTSSILKLLLHLIYAYHHALVNRNGVSIKTMRTDLLTVSYFHFLLLPTRDGKKQRTLTLPVHLVHAFGILMGDGLLIYFPFFVRVIFV